MHIAHVCHMTAAVLQVENTVSIISKEKPQTHFVSCNLKGQTCTG